MHDRFPHFYICCIPKAGAGCSDEAQTLTCPFSCSDLLQPLLLFAPSANIMYTAPMLQPDRSFTAKSRISQYWLPVDSKSTEQILLMLGKLPHMKARFLHKCASLQRPADDTFCMSGYLIAKMMDPCTGSLPCKTRVEANQASVLKDAPGLTVLYRNKQGAITFFSPQGPSFLLLGS